MDEACSSMCVGWMVEETMLTYSPVESISAALISVPEAIVTRESSICCAADNARVESAIVIKSSANFTNFFDVPAWLHGLLLRRLRAVVRQTCKIRGAQA